MNKIINERIAELDIDIEEQLKELHLKQKKQHDVNYRNVNHLSEKVLEKRTLLNILVTLTKKEGK